MLEAGLSAIVKGRYKKILKDQAAPSLAQEAAFQRLRASLRNTQVFSTTELGSSTNLQEFAESAQVRKYDDYAGWIKSTVSGNTDTLFSDSMVYVGLSSGTTAGDSKALPYNARMVKAWEKFQFSVASVIQASSDVQMIRDQRLTWGSTPIVRTDDRGIQQGYVSGFLSMRSPWIIRRKSFPRPESILIPDMNEKMKQMAVELKGVDLRLISGVPSYLLSLFEYLKEQWGIQTLSEAFPNLKTCVYSATAIEPWKAQLNAVVGRELQYIGCYASTEGPFGYEVPALNGGRNGLYQFHYGDLVYLFRKFGEDGRIVGINELEAGDEVELLLSSPNGLVNYSMGDALKIVSVKPTVQFEILGRIGQGMNIAAEKVSMAELNSVVRELGEATQTAIRHFFVYPGRSEKGRPNYQWTFAVDRSEPQMITEWTSLVDQILKKRNFDYCEAREELGFIDTPQVRFISAEIVKAYHQTKASKGQFKMKSNFQSVEDFQIFLNEMLGARTAAA